MFVSVEWRVNALGFLAAPSLSAEDPNGSSGNYGVLDQIKALQWVVGSGNSDLLFPEILTKSAC